MISIENTDQALKVFENYESRAIEPTTTVLLTGASHDDNPEMVTMRAELAEMKVLVATLGTTSIPTTTAGAVHTEVPSTHLLGCVFLCQKKYGSFVRYSVVTVFSEDFNFSFYQNLVVTESSFSFRNMW
jgi:hypothetical protein